MKPLKKLKFIHITKNAGSAIENFGQTININWGKFDTDIKSMTAYLPKMNIHAFWHIPTIYYDNNILKKIMNSYDFFVVVRNPYDRIISEFYCKWGGYPSYLNDAQNNQNNQNNTHTHFINSADLADLANSTNSDAKYKINKWIQYKLIKLKKKLAKYVPKNGHWLPQYFFIYNSNKKNIVKHSNIIHFENITNELNHLFNLYNINADFSKQQIVNSSNKSFNVCDLSDVNINLINKIYANDFKLFGYDKIKNDNK